MTIESRFLQIFINNLKTGMNSRNLYERFERFRIWRSCLNLIQMTKADSMKTATYNVQTCDGISQDITINYTIVPEPLNVIREWCEMNSFRSFDCIPENKMARDNFAWSYMSHIGDGQKRGITCTARRMTWYSSLSSSKHLPKPIPSLSPPLNQIRAGFDEWSHDHRNLKMLESFLISEQTKHTSEHPEIEPEKHRSSINNADVSSELNDLNQHSQWDIGHLWWILKLHAQRS